MQPDAREEARGRWRGILIALGVEEKHLTGKNVPCPSCGGKDRFRFDDKEGRGTWICNRCGAGDGFSLLMRLRGTDFVATVKDVRSVAGVSAFQTSSKIAYTDQQRKKALNDLWRAGKPLQKGDVVDRYLTGRGLDLDEFPPDLRLVAECPVSKVPGVRALPAMIAMVRDIAGKPVTLHRTYLTNEGAKAAIDAPKRLMPGPMPRGAAIRLHDGGRRIGVAEGIETALAASLMFDMPVWSTVNSTLMANFRPPADVEEVAIFGDTDASFGGQAAAYVLAHALACLPNADLEITVSLPPVAGQDWNDVLVSRHRAAA